MSEAPIHHVDIPKTNGRTHRPIEVGFYVPKDMEELLLTSPQIVGNACQQASISTEPKYKLGDQLSGDKLGLQLERFGISETLPLIPFFGRGQEISLSVIALGARRFLFVVQREPTALDALNKPYKVLVYEIPSQQPG